MTEAITSVTEIKKRIIEEFSNANNSIRIAMAYFTDREIAMSIVEANKRGVEIEVVISSSLQNEIVSLILKGSNIPIQVYNTDDKRGSMHHKFCLIDNSISISGSFNFTYNASNRNTENVIITDETSVFKKFNEEFESLINAIENNMEFENEPANMNLNESSINNIDAFVQQLQDLVFSSTKISADDYKLEGFEKSKECFGNVDIYRIEYGNIKECNTPLI
jgi:phosphatidylserine/phosphatidylglycerophosphate/cardiolipin synthase-like enzyme